MGRWRGPGSVLSRLPKISHKKFQVHSLTGQWDIVRVDGSSSGTSCGALRGGWVDLHRTQNLRRLSIIETGPPAQLGRILRGQP